MGFQFVDFPRDSASINEQCLYFQDIEALRAAFQPDVLASQYKFAPRHQLPLATGDNKYTREMVPGFTGENTSIPWCFGEFFRVVHGLIAVTSGSLSYFKYNLHPIWLISKTKWFELFEICSYILNPSILLKYCWIPYKILLWLQQTSVKTNAYISDFWWLSPWVRIILTHEALVIYIIAAAH